MLPVVLISYRHGVKWGLVAGVTYALLEMAIGAKTVAGAFQPGYFGDGVMIINALIPMSFRLLSKWSSARTKDIGFSQNTSAACGNG